METSSQREPPVPDPTGFAGSLRTGLARHGAGSEPGIALRNELLASLSSDTLERLRPRLARVELRRKQVLHERNVPVLYAYFIERGAATLLARSADQGCVEVGTLGRGDLVGLPVVLGTGRTPHRCVVQVPGEAMRIGAEDLKRALVELPDLQSLLLAYVQATMVQGAQAIACSTRHTLRKRLACWLLLARDRLGSDEIPLTHHALSRAIGVRRAGVTIAVGQMEAAGLVRRGRGRLDIVDALALERASCECYRTIRAEQGRVVCRKERQTIACAQAPDGPRTIEARRPGGSGSTPCASAS